VSLNVAHIWHIPNNSSPEGKSVGPKFAPFTSTASSPPSSFLSTFSSLSSFFYLLFCLSSFFLCHSFVSMQIK